MLIASSPSIAAAGRRTVRAPLRRRAPVVLALRHRSFLAREAARLRAHFRQVLTELRARDLTHLSLPQRAARARLIAELERYARAGRFPRNLDFPGVRMPYFVDAKGTRCAMAHLIESAGAPELVARVAASKNNAFIRELSADPELLSWLEAAGLTVAEAGRIQPGYCQFTVAEVCLCGLNYPALAVVEGTVTQSNSGGHDLVVNVTAVHGDTTVATVGKEVPVLRSVDYGTGGDVDSSRAEVGDAVLVTVTSMSPFKGGFASFVVVVRESTSKDSTVEPVCSRDVPEVNKADMIAALLSKDAMGNQDSVSHCSDYLAKLDARWGESQCGGPADGEQPGGELSSGEQPGGDSQGGCSFAGSITASPLMLGSLVVAAMGLRRRRRARRRAAQTR